MEREKRLRTLQESPYNAVPPLDELCRSHITLVSSFYVRNHGPVPAVDAASYRLLVDGLVQRPLCLSLDELREGFEPVDLCATLQCAGNRRAELADFRPIQRKTPWGPQAIGTATWTGIRLRDLLAAAGADPGLDGHVAFEGLDRADDSEGDGVFGCSIPMQKAFSPEVLVAYAMDGEPLPALHGYPLRVVVPGYIGARSVKWLQRITVRQSPSENRFQQRDYRLFPPDVTAETAEWDKGKMLMETPITSVICFPADKSTVPAGRVEICGYACAGGDRLVAEVQVSTNGGGTWVQGRLHGQGKPWQWRLWSAEVDLSPGEHLLICRAVDSAGEEQPQSVSSTWNFEGYVNNAWHRIRVTCTPV